MRKLGPEIDLDVEHMFLHSLYAEKGIRDEGGVLGAPIPETFISLDYRKETDFFLMEKMEEERIIKRTDRSEGIRLREDSI